MPKTTEKVASDQIMGNPLAAITAGEVPPYSEI
jgi:hypothetical protein